jgi:transcriptional regulator with XRE-family HTH domain
VLEVHVPGGFVKFGAELRRTRLAADLSLTGLARVVHYSKGHLSKVERGTKKPSRELARLCDVALGAGGALASLIGEGTSAPDVTSRLSGDDEIWVMRLSSEGHSRFEPMSRRRALAAGAGSIVGMGIGQPVFPSRLEGASILQISRTFFDHYRELGQVVDPGLLLPVLISHTHTLRELSTRTDNRTRQRLLCLGSRYAEYVGWLAQETGDDEAALWWTRRAVRLAKEGGDTHLAVYGLVHALITLYREDAVRTIESARLAQRFAAPSRIRGLAAQREAQGHALIGDYDACMRGLERAHILLAEHEHDPETPIIGPSNLPDPTEMSKGWCLVDLGRPRTAAELLERQLASVPAKAVRTRVRYGMRQALAHASAGEIDHACVLARELLDGAVTVGSATIATDLRKLSRTLLRHPKNPWVRDLAPELGAALAALRA